jgi:hypothetical protein
MKWLVLACSIFTAACSQYSVRRAALVPNLAPTPRTGQPLDGQAELHLGTAHAVSIADPSTSENVGVHVPRIDLNGAVRLRIGADTDIGFVYDEGFEAGSISVRPDQPTPSGNVRGGGVSVHTSFPIAPEWRLAFAADVLLYSIPYVEYRTCTNCMEAWTDISERRVATLVASLGVIGSWRRGPWTVFGGLTMRNHPTTRLSSVEIFASSDEDVSAGPFNVIAAIGAEYAFGPGLRAQLQIYQPIAQDPVAYMPTIAVSFAIPFAR